MKFDTELIKWASDTQKKYLEAVNKYGSIRSAAKELGVHHSTIQKSLHRLKEKAALQNYQPSLGMTIEVPSPYIVKGNSIRVDEAGKPLGGWIKTQLDQGLYKEYIRGIIEGVSAELPRLAPIDGPEQFDKDLCNLFTMTDSHVGMLAWKEEGGESWDLSIAEQVLTACFERMVWSSPKAGTAVIAQLGDFLHSDGLLPVTPTHGHVLDQAARYGDMVKAAIRILRRLVDFALTWHEKVILVVAEGNHDMASSVWMRNLFAVLYEYEDRIQVIDTELPYYVYQHGSTLLGFHHGHIKKPADLPSLFAAQYPELWGKTRRRYAHCGHRHHYEEKEYAGMTVVQHSTLAARDAYAARGGWFSERQVRAMTYHAEEGLVAMNVVTPSMVYKEVA